MLAPIRCSIPVLTLLLAAAAGGQQASQTSPYQGVSHPPADDVITTSTVPEAKPPAGKPLASQPAAETQYQPPAPSYQAPREQPAVQQAPPAEDLPGAPAIDGTDEGIVHVAASGSEGVAPPPDLNPRAASDPDADIVHVRPLRPGELREGTSIRVRLLDRLSTAEAEKGQPFRSRVATDVMEGGQVVIPAGSEIDGRVVEVSVGQIAGHGTMRLDPESVTLANGARYQLHAAVTGTPGSRTRVVGEGTIQPDSRLKRDGIEYGAAVGTGAVTGAIVAGPVGALTGTLIGAGAITVHLMVDHPQATLESGSTLMFTLTEGLYLSPEAASGN